MPHIPFSLQWTIPEDHLIPLKDSINGRLLSTPISNTPDFEYCLKINPNGDVDKRRGQAWIFLRLKLGNQKKVDTEFTITVKSANISRKCSNIYVESSGYGSYIAKTSELFDPDKNFFVDGKFTVKVYGTFKFGDDISEAIEQQKWEGAVLGDKLWKDNTKDFTIVVDGKETKAHKLILYSQSDVFSAMLNSNMRESNENKVVISDFSFDIVEAAVKMIYNCNSVTSFSIDDLMSLLQFFDKYQIPELKDKIESVLIRKISSVSVCRLTNSAILTNSKKLKNACMEFLEVSFASKTPLSDIEILDKDIAFEILQNLVCHSVKTA
uniref:BTB domain-containing protein n=1 Tax=Panagrolaimus davidi TaxID=227884 RepID=A0A914Q3J1_9BILA